MHQVEDYKALNTLFRHTVGCYSERSGYYVFRASEVLQAALTDAKAVNDVNGKQVAVGIFNNDAVKAVLPTLGISVVQTEHLLQAYVSISPHSSMFSMEPSNNKSGCNIYGQKLDNPEII